MTNSEALSPERGALSVDEAAELLIGDEDEAPADGAAMEGDPDEEVEDGEEDRADAPHFWSAEDKAAFAELPPHLQARVAAYEKNRDDATARVIQEAAEARNRAAAEAEQAAALNAQLSETLPQVQAAFARAWGNVEPNWLQMAQTHGPQEAVRMRERFAQDLAQVQQLQAMNAQSEARRHEAYVEGEARKLKALEPELADPARGEERRGALARFLLESGFPAEQIRHAGAQELSIAYDALRWRQARAGMAGSQRPAAARAGVKPAAAQTQSSQSRRAASVKARFASDPSIDNAVAAILAKG
jgi:hypothetical protein